MGAPEKRIPADARAKQLAEKLRELRRAAGTPSYRAMGKAIYVRHNTLSRVASGEYITWPCVQNYVRALTVVGGVVTDDQIEELRVLWQEAKLRHTAECEANAATTAEKRPIRTFEMVTGSDVTGDIRSALTFPLVHQQPDTWQRLGSGRGQNKLAEISTAQALVAALNDLAQAHRIDLRELRTAPHMNDFTTFGGVPRRDGEEAWEVLTGRRAPTLPAVRRIVVDICGCPESGFWSWEAAWQRVQNCDLTSIAAPALPAVSTVGTDAGPALLGDVGDLGAATICPAPAPSPAAGTRVAAGPTPPLAVDAERRPAPRPPLWRRLLRLR